MGPSFRYLYKNARSTSSPSRWRRSDGLHREAQSRFNAALQARLAELPPGEPLLMEVVSWLQDRGAEFLTPPAGELLPPPATTADDVRAADGEEFCRYWIYSHHIYSKVKRRSLQELAEQFRLTGFCLPGKPGIICVEVRYLLHLVLISSFSHQNLHGFLLLLAVLWIGFLLMLIRTGPTPTTILIRFPILTWIRIRSDRPHGSLGGSYS